ncbi:MAG: hypothetical protein ACO2ZP_09000 [Bacteriovoracaceae bacterium]
MDIKDFNNFINLCKQNDVSEATMGEFSVKFKPSIVFDANNIEEEKEEENLEDILFHSTNN